MESSNWQAKLLPANIQVVYLSRNGRGKGKGIGMGCCATCGVKLGFRGSIGRKVSGQSYCLSCALKVIGERRQRVLSDIFTDSLPRIVIAAGAVCCDPDHPSNARRFTGPLLLTDTGVIFAQNGEYQKAAPQGIHVLLVGWLLALVLGADKDRKNRMIAGARANIVDRHNAFTMLEEARQAFYYPLRTIKKLKTTRSTIEIKLAERSVKFEWLRPKESIRPRQRLLETYVRAINDGQDIIAECLQLAKQ